MPGNISVSENGMKTMIISSFFCAKISRIRFFLKSGSLSLEPLKCSNFGQNQWTAAFTKKKEGKKEKEERKRREAKEKREEKYNVKRGNNEKEE